MSYSMESKVEEALIAVRRILDNTRNPKFAPNVQHHYTDKFLLVEFLVNTSTAAQLNCLRTLGATDDTLKKMKDWSKSKTVTLRLSSQQKCSFEKETEKSIESPEIVEQSSGTFGTKEKKTKVITKVKEYWWNVEENWEVSSYEGNKDDNKIVLAARTGKCIVKTSSDKAPYPKTTVRPVTDVEVGWLFQYTNDDLAASFKVDRNHKDCHTPRRNEDTQKAEASASRIAVWAAKVATFFTGTLFTIPHEHALDLSSVHARGVFVPVLPLFEEQEGGESVCLHAGDVNKFLDEQMRSLNERLATLGGVFPADAKAGVIGISEVRVAVANRHLQEVCRSLHEGVDSVEEMLRKQIIEAIGKVVQPNDFGEYMTVHNRKLFKPEFRMQPFCHAVRWGQHYPEGTVSLEMDTGSGSGVQPVHTLCKGRSGEMTFSLNAATKVKISGDQYLHAWVGHAFSGNMCTSLQLIARARQFSSFIVVIGRIAGPGQFDARHAMIVQNKDDLNIPLDLETIPSAKAFRDAISSLSPEQQRFAKAFRSMQLESTLFGMAIIQIKPQLERLLNLPSDSLTKEIKLTQDLLEMFIKYQIPSDLMSFDGDEDESAGRKVATVRKYVDALQAMIAESRKKELEEKKEEAKYERPLGSFGGPPSPSGAGLFGARMMMRPIAADGSPPPVNQAILGARKMKRRCAAPAAPAPMQAMAFSMAAPPPPPAVACGALPQAPPAPCPQPPSETPSAPESTGKTPERGPDVDAGPCDEGVIDYTKVPGELDARLDAMDSEGAVRPTIIKPGSSWVKKDYASLLVKEPATHVLAKDEQKTEKDRAFDLLDALSKSGGLSIPDSSLHIVMGATHCFDKSCLETLVQDNVNPIERFEATMLLIGGTLHGLPVEDLVNADQLPRLAEFHTSLLAGAGKRKRDEA